MLANVNSIVFVNPAFTTLTGYSASEVLGRNARFLQGPQTDLAVVAEIREAVAAGVPIRREILNYRKSGEPFWNNLSIDPIHDSAGRLIGFVGVQDDVTAKHLADAAHAVAEARLQTIISQVPGFIYRRTMDPDGSTDLPYLSPSVNRFLGVPEGETVTGAQYRSHVHPDDQPGLAQAVRQSAADLSVFHEEFRLVSSDGQIRWFRSYAAPRRLPSGETVWDGLAIDITADKDAVSELAFLAFHDSITGLSNREMFKSNLLNAIQSPADGEGQIGVLLVDIDAFQEINDALGLAVGDDVLRAAGRRLTDLIQDQGGMVARHGGDEFALLLPELTDGQSIAQIAEDICAAINGPIWAASQEIVIQACVGAASIDRATARQSEKAACAAELMKQADVALHAAKRAGRGSHQLYIPQLDDRLQNEVALRQALPQALAQGQFRLHYQPQVDLASGQIIGAEALVRWHHPEFGLIRPDLFIPLAEASGLIVPLGAWVVREAMRQSQAWKALGVGPLRIAINVSSIQLRKPGFVAVVQQALAETGAKANEFEFELTEGLLIEASSEILSILTELKLMGFGITIDDFGTGHATFKYLRDFPIDKLKIDQVFVRQLVIDSSDAFIIRAIVALSRSLGIKVVAEGIESDMQLDFLRDEGCETGQGYLFSMPLVPEDVGWLLENQVALPLARRAA